MMKVKVKHHVVIISSSRLSCIRGVLMTTEVWITMTLTIQIFHLRVAAVKVKAANSSSSLEFLHSTWRALLPTVVVVVVAVVPETMVMEAP